ncbi:MAG: RNA-binding S4 domain-containing protein [Firmicutes bacterium]|nr:RNA-binding S4 domain-containing protein [Bacillota bacterium]
MSETRVVSIHTPTIRLDQFLKWAGAAPTGGQAKQLIGSGQVLVNGRTETRRAHSLSDGDQVEVAGSGLCLQVQYRPGR